MASKKSKVDPLESGMDFAAEQGLINVDVSTNTRKSTSKGPTTRKRTNSANAPKTSEMLTPEERRIENEKKLQSIINGTNKRRLISQLKAFQAYFPDIAAGMSGLSLEDLEPAQLQRLYDCFEENVLSSSELSSIPATIKGILGKAEDTLMAVGISNYDNPYLSPLTKVHGMSEAINRDPDIDRNVKLISVKLAGRLPRSPYLNVLSGMIRVGWDCVIRNTAVPTESDPKFSKLNK